MKIYTLLFILSLYTISCTNELLKFKPTEHEIQQNLVELAKEPLSEGIFATMATQLSTEGGFTRVVALLNQLIQDGKSQLHGITKTWRGVSTRCNVSKVMLQTRKDFFDAQVEWTKKVISHRKEDIVEQEDLLKTYTHNSSVLRALHKASLARHAHFVKLSASNQAHIKEALKLAKDAKEQITHWTPRGAALIQTNISKILKGYFAASSHSLSDPTELIQRSSSSKVRARLLQWISILIGRLGLALDHYKLCKKRVEHWVAYDKNINELANSLSHDALDISKHISGARADVKTFHESEELYAKLVLQTQKLISANKQYCEVESNNFHRNQKRIHDEIHLFEEVLRYFRNHYKRVHDFIRSKYNHEE